MGYTSEQIQRSIELAEQIATEERIGKGNAERAEATSSPKLKAMRADSQRKQRERFGGCLETLLADPLAEKLLPQARIRLDMRQVRMEGIEDTTKLGVVMNAISHEQELEMYGGDRRTDWFADELEQHAWSEFLAALDKGNRLEILLATQMLFMMVESSLGEMEIPPAPLPYVLPD